MGWNYVIADACGNTTAFVQACPPPESRGALARRVLAELGVEQAGFLHHDRMDMMGGEFCGNASRAFGLWQALQREGPWPRTETIRVSGAEEPLTVTVAREEDGYRAAISMPLPLDVAPGRLGDAPVTCVRFAGITHLVCAHPPREQDMSLARAAFASDAIGLLYVSGDTMRPLVWVRDTDSLCWESSCASGTCAAAAARALAAGESLTLALQQPGGCLTAAAEVRDGRLTGLMLDGPVALTGEGTIAL